MKINYTDGRSVTVRDEEEAYNLLVAEFPEVTFSSNGSPSATIDESELRQNGRVLAWRNEKESENDDGAKAVAEVSIIVKR